MDSSTLRRLAADGFSAIPGSQLRDLAAWCQDWCEATGEVRYCILAGTLASIDDWLGEHGVPQALSHEVQLILRSGIPAILDAEPSSGALLAVSMREEVAPLLISSTKDWIEQGYAEGPSGPST